ncbi:hypothetical protein N7474_001896 [Penicillium riverlandense]|uniref:uncharacterized protein n=1 Tax=Penicillium riverlandense TaxID=1903569 RepID=UPI002546B27D|nr:uncharacterized protein N7474_001896 [Penicillium riverlandense]KAJ5833585.1 hypothetical protein N7474_001896 [Penicillium riverlandense]
MASEWHCTVCPATFTRAEHLKRHNASRSSTYQPYGPTLLIDPMDILRRHEKTCKSRVHSSFENEGRVHSDEERQSKRRCSIGLNDPATLPLPEADPLALDFSFPGWDYAEPTQVLDSLATNSRSTSELAKLDSSSYFTGNDLLADIPSPLDFSTLDLLYSPQLTSDIILAERLEYLAYFTSSRGMATFADRQSFRRSQKIVMDAYEAKLLQQPTPRINHADGHELRPDLDPSPTHESISDPLDAKSHQLVDSLRTVICGRRNDDVITLDWSPSRNKLCQEFFSPPNIRRFLEYFWSLWYPHCPIVHRPLFDSDAATPALLCVMVVIGACLSSRDSDYQTARMWLDSVEELTFGHVCFRKSHSQGYDDISWKKEMLQCIQAAYLVCSLQKREGSAEAQARIRRYRHASMVTLARNIGPGNASHRNLRLDEASLSWWKQFAEEEELIRTLIFVFLIDTALVILHNSPPRMVIPEMKMDVSCPEACFQAESASECLVLLREWAHTRFWKDRLSVVSVVRRICQNQVQDNLINDYARLGTLNLFTVVQGMLDFFKTFQFTDTIKAIHSLMFHLQNSLVFESTLAPVQTGLENWRRIWNERIPEDQNIPDTAENIWKKVGFLRQASEFWHLARIFAAKIGSTSDGFDDPAETASQMHSSYDHTDMGDVNGLIMEYRRLNLGVS